MNKYISFLLSLFVFSLYLQIVSCNDSVYYFKPNLNSDFCNGSNWVDNSFPSDSSLGVINNNSNATMNGDDCDLHFNINVGDSNTAGKLNINNGVIDIDIIQVGPGSTLTITNVTIFSIYHLNIGSLSSIGGLIETVNISFLDDVETYINENGNLISSGKSTFWKIKNDGSIVFKNGNILVVKTFKNNNKIEITNAQASASQLILSDQSNLKIDSDSNFYILDNVTLNGNLTIVINSKVVDGSEIRVLKFKQSFGEFSSINYIIEQNTITTDCIKTFQSYFLNNYIFGIRINCAKESSDHSSINSSESVEYSDDPSTKTPTSSATKHSIVKLLYVFFIFFYFFI